MMLPQILLIASVLTLLTLFEAAQTSPRQQQSPDQQVSSGSQQGTGNGAAGTFGLPSISSMLEMGINPAGSAIKMFMPNTMNGLTSDIQHNYEMLTGPQTMNLMSGLKNNLQSGFQSLQESTMDRFNLMQESARERYNRLQQSLADRYYREQEALMMAFQMIGDPQQLCQRLASQTVQMGNQAMQMGSQVAQQVSQAANQGTDYANKLGAQAAAQVSQASQTGEQAAKKFSFFG